MVRVFKVKGIKDTKYLDGILSVLVEILNIKASFFKPRFSRTYEVKIEGADEEKAFNLFTLYAAKVGWKIE